MARSIMVTGASGYIGGHAVPALLDTGWEVRTVGRRPAPASPPGGVVHHQVDLAEAGPSIDAALQGITHVLHLAGASSSFSDETQMRRNNVAVTRNLVDAAARSGQVERLLHMSTTAVYGEAEQLLLPIPEDITPHPSRSYGKTKWEAEQAVWEGSERGLPVTVLRPVSVYGPAAVKLVASAILDTALERHAGRGVLEILPDPVEQRLVHIDDVVAACLHLLTNDAAAGHAFNLASGTYPTSHELARALSAAFEMEVALSADGGLTHEARTAAREQLLASGMDGSILLTTQRLAFLSRGNRNNRVSLDALAATGFTPQVTDLTTSIATLVDWYRERRWII